MHSLNRRQFAQLAAGALLTPSLVRAAAPGKPNSKVGGVHIGINAPYSFGNAAMSADDILKTCGQLNLSAIELRTQPIEAQFGAPANLTSAKNKVLPAGAAEDSAKQLRTWRETVDMEKARAFRKHWETTGVFIEVIKVDGIFKMGESELDYAFTLAKALGAHVGRHSGILTVKAGTEIHGLDMDLSAASELTPTLVGLAAFASSPTTIRGIGHIRLHETDRIAALIANLRALGGEAEELPDGLRIIPRPLHGGTWKAYHDHRMATTGALIGLRVPGVEIDDIGTTAKTLPEFTMLWERMLRG